MAVEILYENDVTRALEQAKGSDGRINVSARSDDRGYYNARDEGLAFTWVYDHLNSLNGEWSFTIQNTSLDKTLIISSIGINSDLGARMRLSFVDTISGGSTLTGNNTNSVSANTLSSRAAALEHADSTAITASEVTPIDELLVGVGEHGEIHMADRVRLGQDKAIGLKVILVTSGTPDIYGVIYGYYE